MTIDEAIEILSSAAYDKVLTTGVDFTDALKLGGEALKRLSVLRRLRLSCALEPLQGEAIE